MGNNAAKSTLTPAEISQNLDNIRAYVSEHPNDINSQDRRQLEAYFLAFGRDLKKAKNVGPIRRKLDVVRTELKQVPNAPTPPNYTLPKVSKLVKVFEDQATTPSGKQPKRKNLSSAMKELQMIENLIKNRTITSDDADKVHAKLIRLAHQFQHRKHDPETEKILEKISKLQAQIVQVNRLQEEAATAAAQKQPKVVPDQELDKAAVETLSFTHYPGQFLEHTTKISGDFDALEAYIAQSLVTCSAPELEKFAGSIEALEHRLKAIKTRIYQENFKWTKNNSRELIHTLHQIENELNTTDFGQYLREKGKNPTLEVLKNYEKRTSQVLDLDANVRAKKEDIFTYIKGQEDSLNSLYIETVLNKMEGDHNRFKAHIDNFNSSESSQDYKNFLKYLYDLRKYPLKLHAKEKALQDRKQALLVDIDASIKQLKQAAKHYDAHKSTILRKEKEKVAQAKLVQSYQAKLDELEKKIADDDGVTPNLKIEYRKSLEVLRDQFVSLNATPNGTIDRNRARIDRLIETIGSGPIIKTKYDSLKKKVQRFSGTFQNILYRSIEADLREILIETHDPQLAQDITKQLQILEEKSTKTTTNQSEETLKLVRNKIDAIRRNSQVGVKPSLAIKTEMDDCYDRLDSLITRDKSVQDERMSLYKEIKQVEGSLGVEIREKAAQMSLKVEKQPQVDNVKNMALIRRELDEIKARIGDGTTRNEVIRAKLDHCLGILARIKEPSLVEERSSLYKDIGYLGEVLDAKTSVFDEVSQRLRVLRPKVKTFVGLEDSVEFVALDVELEALEKRLEAVKEGEEGRKKRLMGEVRDLSHALEERLWLNELLGDVEKRGVALMLQIDGLSNNLRQEDLVRLGEEAGRLLEMVKGVEEGGELGERKVKLVGELETCRERLEQLTV